MSSKELCADSSACFAMHIEWEPIGDLQISDHHARKHPPTQIHQITSSLKRFGWMTPLVVDSKNAVIVGAGRLLAARHAKFSRVPVIRVLHLSDDEVRAYRIADNKLAENSNWDDPKLNSELRYLIKIDVSLVLATGFAMPELDMRLNMGDAAEHEDEESASDVPALPVTRSGDIWIIGDHRLICGDARDPNTVGLILDGRKIRLILEDRPFNVPVQGHVSGLGKHKHKEFAMASGEMSREEFQHFLETVTAASKPHLLPGALSFQFIDWRHLEEMAAAQRHHFGDMFNLAVWGKTNGGMGSFYRSQTEFCVIHKNGNAPHINNVQLGRFGRYRSNLWLQAGANSFGKTRDADLEAHPTVKPTQLIADIILDASDIEDCIFDGFIGSGSTLLACARTDRVGRGIEIDPSYVDVALKRLTKATKLPAILQQTNQTFDEVARERNSEERRDGR